MIPLFKVRMSPVIEEPLTATVLSGFIAQGPRVDELEKAAQDALRSPIEPIAVNSATSAIDLALDLIGVEAGDEVISTPMTCFASNVGAIRRGAKMVWADVLPESGNIDPDDVTRKVTNKTKAIIAVDWAGQFADYGALKSHGVPVIEDAAHHWDAFSHNEVRGDYVVYSLQAIKFLTAGDGGLLITPPDKHHQARNLRWYGLDRDNNENFRQTQDIKQAGFKYNMNDVSATIALANIRFAKDSVMQHMANAAYLDERLNKAELFNTVPYSGNTSYWVFPVIMKQGVNRNVFEEYMVDAGVQAAQVHFRNDNYSVVSQFKTPLPGLDTFSSSHTNIPCGWWLSQDELDLIADVALSLR